ncbi:MAG: hypothetical protein CMJ31_05595 [Phycisphaerae bacterium]|nr:hypothetical protein [Phycisphaerae bacterium]
MMNVLSRFAVRSVLALAVLFAAAPGAFAEDVVELKTGETVRGEIVRELDGSVWLIESFGTVKRERFFAASQILAVTRDVPENADVEEGRIVEDETPSAIAPPKGAVISLEGTVGIQMTAQKLRDLIPQLEKDLGTDGTGIVVFKINSGGGLLLEIDRLHKVIVEEYKPRFQVCSWIESAISAAAMTSHVIENIYFKPEGNYGACTGWSGALQAVKGYGYESVLYQMEIASDQGGYDQRIMRAMQGHPDESHFGAAWPLSCTIDERGNVTWFQSADDGEMVVNPVGEVLTLNSEVAKRVGFSKGTARTLDDLTELLGYDEIDWVGKSFEGRIYPVSKAEEEMIKFREVVTEDEARLGEYQAKYNVNFGAAQGAPRDIRGRYVGRARQHLARVAAVVRNNPNFALLEFNTLPEDFERDVIEYQEGLLRELMRAP